jgi:hypothetical protein
MKSYRAALNCDERLTSDSETCSAGNANATDDEFELSETSENDNSLTSYNNAVNEGDSANTSSDTDIANESDSDTDNVNAIPNDDDSSSSNSSGDVQPTLIFLQGLAKWAFDSKTSREQLNDLLGLLRKSGRFNDLPKDARSLLGTPKSVDSITRCGGEYIYFGLKDKIILALSYSEVDTTELHTIVVDVNFDGLPIHASTKISFWPILCNISVLAVCPFVVGLYCGNQKPTDVHEYLKDFVDEVILLTNEGFSYCNKQYKFKLRSAICDAPARAFIKCISGHTSKNGCERCVAAGTSVERRIVYLTHSGELRTNESFRNEACAKGSHRTGDSPLLKIPDFNIINSCILDSMHLIYQGVCKRFLSFLKGGPRQIRLSQTQIQSISEKLCKLSQFTPSEFARRPRSLGDMERWKATEFRQFTLYTGVVVLQDVISKDVYQLFLALSLSVRILHLPDSRDRSKYLGFARQLLNTFVHNCRIVCGQTFVTYNVHSLIHIPDDVEFNQCSLGELSSFPFENYLHYLKHLVTNASRCPLVSVVKRIQEGLNVGQFGYTMKDSRLKLSLSPRDRFFISCKDEYCEITNIVGEGAATTYQCSSIKRKNLKALFQSPIDSRELGIYLCDNITRVKRKAITIRKHEVKQKLYAMQYNDETSIAFFPVLHVND